MKKRVEAFLKNPKTHSETFDDGDGGTERVSGRVAVECLDQATKDDIIMLLLDDMLCLAEIEAKRAFKEQIEHDLKVADKEFNSPKPLNS